MKRKSISAEEFDILFDDGGELGEYLKMDQATRPGLESRRVNIDFPAWMVQALDHEAQRLGVTRQSVIKFWISEKLNPLVK
jgi:hypothetical protein